MNRERVRSGALLLAITAYAALIITIFPSAGTLLYEQCAGDYIIFQTIGSGWLDGKLPYVELFDHKGPLIFAIYSLGIWLCKGKMGVWLLELVFVAASMWMLFLTGRAMRLSLRKCVFGVLMSGILLGLYIEGGGTVEEFSLPFQMLPLLMAVRYLSGNKVTPLTTIAFVSGLCFALTAMIRVNNNIVVCAVVIALSIILIHRREWRTLLLSIAWFLGGLALGLLPFVAYFASHGALDECIYSTFTYNFKYLAAQHDKLGLHGIATFAVTLLSCAIMCVVGARDLLKNRFGRNTLAIMFIMLAAVTALVLVQGGDYRHYFIMAIPAAIATYYYIATHYGRVGVILTTLAVLLPLFGSAGYLARQYRVIKSHVPVSRGWIDPVSRAIIENVPANDLDSVYIAPYRVYYGAYSLAQTGHYPVGTYFFMQPVMCKNSDDIRRRIAESFERANPKWLLTEYPLEDLAFIRDKDRYEIVTTYSEGSGFRGCLYRRRPSQ